VANQQATCHSSYNQNFLILVSLFNVGRSLFHLQMEVLGVAPSLGFLEIVSGCIKNCFVGQIKNAPACLGSHFGSYIRRKY
jgi:hypothetical protein